MPHQHIRGSRARVPAHEKQSQEKRDPGCVYEARLAKTRAFDAAPSRALALQATRPLQGARHPAEQFRRHPCLAHARGTSSDREHHQQYKPSRGPDPTRRHGWPATAQRRRPPRRSRSSKPRVPTRTPQPTTKAGTQAATACCCVAALCPGCAGACVGL